VAEAGREKIVCMMINATTLDEEKAWEQLQARDGNADFFYGVSTTGVFCRPGCSSRLPLRENTRFFPGPMQASAAGFRPCQRCSPEKAARPSAVAAMCALLEREIDRAVTLEELGRLTGLSSFTAQRAFKQAMGATPAQYQRAMRASALRSRLHGGATVTDAIYEAGYGSASRAYEAAPLGMTPARFQAGGRGEVIGFAVAECTGANAGLGWLIVAGTARGLCWVALGDSPEMAEAGLRAEFPAAEIRLNAELAAGIDAVLGQMSRRESARNLPLDLRGTAFQLQVWQALQRIPAGETRSYSQLAREMGIPAATRAVARACATNRVAILVPCHRVVGVTGSLTGYRWGVERKRQLLDSERGMGG
jgi:AraC family transcriptional regulator of adaptative response/methylated-DNA-[protein]-cysteine methyltransferase